MQARRQGGARDERSTFPAATCRRSSPAGGYSGRTAVRARASALSPKPSSSGRAAPKPRPGRPPPNQSLRCNVEQSEVTKFLRQIGLMQYAQTLYSSGFEDMETLLEIEDSHMRDLGMLPGHQVKLRKRLEEFDADIPVVQIHPQRCLGDWEDEDDAPPVRVSASSPYGRGSAPSDRTTTSVQMSWAHLKEIGTDVVGAYFCRKIFELKPETMELFPIAVRSRYRDWATDEDEDERNLAASPALRRLFGRVVDAVGSAVAGLQDMNKMVPALTQLGMRHVGYNLKEEYFEISEKALVLTLREGLGDLFTKEVEFAWSMVYNFIIATMLAGFRTARAEVQAKQA
ncbi:hmp, partial [Symbiodinium natans]